MHPSPARLLARAELPALLITDLVNVRYLTGVCLSSGIVLVLPRSYILFCDARYSEMARQRANAGVLVRDSAFLQRFLRRIDVCGFEEEHVTVARLRHWRSKFPNTKFVRIGAVIEGFRRQKDDEELQCIRRAQRITEEILRRVPSVLRSTTTERGLAWKLRVWAQELGADGMAFDPIVAFGTHTSCPHHQPTTRALRRGHIVQVDVGAVYRGYCGDLSRVYFTAEPPRAVARAYRAVREAKDAVIEQVRAGVSTHDLDRTARAALKRHGLEEFFCHALGHGVGLQVHEGVSLSQRAPEETLLPGEVITVEPGVYVPGKFGIRLEEMVVVE